MTKLEEKLPEMYRQMHREGAFKGDSWRQHLDGLKGALALRPSGRILDYGCGPTGGLAKYFGDVVISHDPYVEKYADDPWGKQFDVFFSSDVFEHLPLETLLQLVRRICKHKPIAIVYIALSTRHANKIMPNGLNAHLTVRSAQWWKGFFEGQMFPHFRFVKMEADLLREEATFSFTRIGSAADDPRDSQEQA